MGLADTLTTKLEKLIDDISSKITSFSDAETFTPPQEWDCARDFECRLLAIIFELKCTPKFAHTAVPGPYSEAIISINNALSAVLADLSVNSNDKFLMSYNNDLMKIDMELPTPESRTVHIARVHSRQYRVLWKAFNFMRVNANVLLDTIIKHKRELEIFISGYATRDYGMHG